MTESHVAPTLPGLARRSLMWLLHSPGWHDEVSCGSDTPRVGTTESHVAPTLPGLA